MSSALEELYGMDSRGELVDLNIPRPFLKQILEGLSFLHTHGVLHRDLKLANIPVDDSLTMSDPMVGTWGYNALEIRLGSEQYSFPADIWDVGCIFAEMVASTTPFPGSSHLAEMTETFSCPPDLLRMFLALSPNLVNMKLNWTLITVSLINYGLFLAQLVLFRSDSISWFESEVRAWEYKAPEILLGSQHYPYPVDVWAVGCIFAEMVMIKPLFSGCSGQAELTEIFRVWGIPTEDTWPGVSSLPCYEDLRSVPGLDQPRSGLALEASWFESKVVANSKLRNFTSSV
ncbi:hypothetical protein LguiB_001441 [Lonicera macranthoides]